MGEISLRRRLDPSLLIDVYEVKLDDEYLMSSLYTGSEEALARLALAETPGTELDVVVGGLGLGFTARAVLEDARVRSLSVIEASAPVIDWHRRGLLPLAADLTGDPRCQLVEGDFFAMVARDALAVARPDAVIVDIDHSPTRHLHPNHAAFYEQAGLTRMAERLGASGVFALWSDDAPDAQFLSRVRSVFPSVEAHIVRFPTHGGTEGSATVYVARTSSSGAQS